MKRVLYIGGFDMPDGNAAAQRVLGIAKIMRKCDCEVQFVGLSRKNPGKGEIDGFAFENLPYPRGFGDWIEYLIKGKNFIEKIKRFYPDIVVFYNHPSLAMERINRLCQKNNIKTIADITEWYVPTGNPIFKMIKRYDTNRRMRKSHLRLNGLINISRFLDDYYADKSALPRIILPPLVDKGQSKWHQPYSKQDKRTFVYAGSPGSNKDRIDWIVNAFGSLTFPNVSLNVIGISEEQYLANWKQTQVPKCVSFKGRLPHREVIKELLAADFQIFIRPDVLSNRAGFPTKFVEAVTSGTLPITNLSSNLEEYLRDGINGFVISSCDQESITECLLKVTDLSFGDIEQMKENLNKDLFDYRNYLNVFAAFLSEI